MDKGEADMYNCASVKYILMAIGVIAVLYIFAGSRPAGKGKFTEEPLSYGNVMSVAGLSYIILMVSERFMTFTEHADYKNIQQYYYGLSHIYVNFIYYDALIVAAYIAAGVFWFFSGLWLYRLLTGRERILSSPRTLSARIICAVIAVPAITLIKVITGNNLEFSWGLVLRRTVDRLEGALRTYGFHLVPAVIVMFVLAWFFIRVIKREIFGIIIITVAVLAIFCGDISGFYTPGGVNLVLFPAGLLAARYERKLIAFLKKTFILWTVVLPVLLAGSVLIAGYRYGILEKLGLISTRNGLYTGLDRSNWQAFTVAYILMAVAVCMLLILVLMKFKTGSRITRIIGASLFELIWLSYCFRGIFEDGLGKEAGAFAGTLITVAVSVTVYLIISKITSCGSSVKKGSAT